MAFKVDTLKTSSRITARAPSTALPILCSKGANLGESHSTTFPLESNMPRQTNIRQRPVLLVKVLACYVL